MTTRDETTVHGSAAEPATEKRGFEDGLKELEGIVNRLEVGTLSLEDSLAAFERGIGLVRELATRLDEVERRVEVLLRDDEDSKLRVHELGEDEES